MESRKKLIITLVVMCVALVIAVTGVVVVLVASTATNTSKVNVQFTADRVKCNISGSVYKYGDTQVSENFLITDENGHETAGALIINSSTTSAAFNPKQISLTSTSSRVVFEYRFYNVETNMTVDLVGYPILNNINVGYAVSTSAIASSTLLNGEIATTDTFEPQTIASGSERYMYIVIEVDDLMSSARYDGIIQWALSRV